MKYIRTINNEIIYVGDLIKDEYGNYCKPETIETDMEVSKEYIIKEADTIEELLESIDNAEPSEALKIIYNNIDYLTSDVIIENDEVNNCLKTIKEQLSTVERALQRLESIENTNPNEALKELENVIEEITISNDDLRNTLRTAILIAIIKQSLLKSQEQEKEFNEYKQLEEQIGCPLETYVKLHNKAHIYDAKGKSLKVLHIMGDTVVVRKIPGRKIFLLLNKYKKTWWLKADKSE